jgi:4-amino-4-deoxychorismate lyase
MYPFIETIRIEDCKIWNLPYHQERLNRTMTHFWPETKVLDLKNALKDAPLTEEETKARVVYDKDGVKDVSFAPYHPLNIHSLKLVTCNDINYDYKSVDRSQLQKLKEQRGDCDEIVIVRNGLLTETSYSNIALFDDEHWYTPKQPLLKGTMRQSLIDQGILQECDLRLNDLVRFTKVSLINAMMPLGFLEVGIKNVVE